MIKTVIDHPDRPFTMLMNRSRAQFWANLDRSDVIDAATGEILAHYPRRRARKGAK